MICLLLVESATWLTWLGAFATIMSVVVMIVVGFSALTAYLQFKQSQEALDRMKDQVTKVENDYKLSQLKPPDQIVSEVQALYDPQVMVLRGSLEWMQKEFGRQLQDIEKLLAQAASKDSILREVETRFKDPKDLEEVILRKVLDAFLRVQNLSQSEQQSISEALAADRSNQPSTTPATVG